MGEEALFDPKQLNLSFTIAIVKPDTVLEPDRLKQVITSIESADLVIRNMFQRELFREEASNLFYKHQGKPYFDDLVSYITSGECCVMLLVNADKTQGEPIQKWKKIIGPSNPEEAKKLKPESLRAKYGKTLIRNEFHGSDSLMEANKERKIFLFKVPQKAPQFTHEPYKVSIQSIQKFLKPPNLEHSCINQRMDVMALYGPIVRWHSFEQCFCVECKPIARERCSKEKTKLKSKILKTLKQAQIEQIFNELCEKCRSHCEGYTHLMGGRELQHVLTDNEISELAKESNKKQLQEMLTIQKGSTAKIMIEQIAIKEPSKIQYNYELFLELISPLSSDYYGRYNFTELQNIILEDRRIRIAYWVSQIASKPIQRFPAVTTLDNTLTQSQLRDPKSPYFTLSRRLPLTLLIRPHELKHVPLTFAPGIVDKPKLAVMEQNLKIEKLLHRNLTKVVVVGEKSEGIREAVSLLRNYQEGRHGDWDNYANLKGNSAKGIVGGKAMARHIEENK